MTNQYIFSIPCIMYVTSWTLLQNPSSVPGSFCDFCIIFNPFNTLTWPNTRPCYMFSVIYSHIHTLTHTTTTTKKILN